jgi:hypothetical protein
MGAMRLPTTCLVLLCGCATFFGAIPQPCMAADGDGRIETAAPANTPVAAATLPNDTDLEAAGARIGTIEIRAHQIFDVDNPKENHALFRAANRLHVRTRESVLRAQLLFQSGDLYSARVLQETERNLRNLSFLREPHITPLRYHDGLVDVLVEVHDVWTLQIGPSFGRSGGKNHTSLSFEDANLLGWGKTLIFGLDQSVDRNSTTLEWRDPNVWGSRWQDILRYTNSSDGQVRSVEVWRPFYALNVRRSYGMLYSDSALTDTRYRLGDPYDDYHHTQRNAGLYIGYSPGLTAGRTIRYTVGWQLAHDDFRASPTGSTLGPLPGNRHLVYPYARIDLVRDDFITTRNLELIDRTEDLQFGLNGSLLVGEALPLWGADRHATITSASISWGREITHRQQYYLTGAFNNRIEQGQSVDQRWSASALYYWRTSQRTLARARMSVIRGSHLDQDNVVELGGDNGLRGYPLRYQRGTGLSLINLEERVYTDWTLWQLFDIGGAAFFDAGRIHGQNTIGVPDLGWLKDVGIGLRLGNSRSSLGNVIHVDIAAPLNRMGSIKSIQYLVSTHATF